MTANDLKNYFNKILTFYVPSKAGYWNSITKCCIDEKPTSVKRYYLDFKSKADYPDEFSKEGIPLYSFKGKPKIAHPIVIAQFALGLYELLYKQDFKDEELKRKYINVADWFKMNKSDFKNGFAWYIHYKFPDYGLNNSWISCMAQGEAISVLTRAAFLTTDDEYISISLKALDPFQYDVKDGGIVNYFQSIPLYEEFPSTDKTMAVLNGFIFSLFGLFDLILATNESKPKSLFDEGVNSLQKLLPYYDFGYWTRYFLYDYPEKYCSSYTYHILVTEQLKVMYHLTNESVFLEYHKKWKEYSYSFLKKSRALINKLFYANKVTP